MQSKSGRAEYELSRRERRKTGGNRRLDRKRYGGIGNIFKDSAKDIVNNWKGLHYGLENRGKCINLLERKLP